MNLEGEDPVLDCLRESQLQEFASRKWYTPRSWLGMRRIEETADNGGKTPEQFYSVKLEFLKTGKIPKRTGLKTKAWFWFWISFTIMLAILPIPLIIPFGELKKVPGILMRFRRLKTNCVQTYFVPSISKSLQLSNSQFLLYGYFR